MCARDLQKNKCVKKENSQQEDDRQAEQIALLQDQSRRQAEQIALDQIEIRRQAEQIALDQVEIRRQAEQIALDQVEIRRQAEQIALLEDRIADIIQLIQPPLAVQKSPLSSALKRFINTTIKNVYTNLVRSVYDLLRVYIVVPTFISFVGIYYRYASDNKSTVVPNNQTSDSVLKPSTFIPPN